MYVTVVEVDVMSVTLSENGYWILLKWKVFRLKAVEAEKKIIKQMY